MSPLHRLFALIVVFIWGTNFVVIKIGLEELPPFAFAALRFFLVAFPLICFIRKPSCGLKPLISYGCFIGLGQFGLLFWGMNGHISPGLASLIVQTQVFFTVILSIIMLGETLAPKHVIALGVASIGLLIIIFNTDGSATPFGIIIILLAGLSWSFGNMVIKTSGPIQVFPFMIWSSLFAVPPLLLISIFTEGGLLPFASIQNLSVHGWLVVLWQTIGNTIIGYGLWNLLLARYPAAQVTPWALLVPVFGMGASALVLAESLPWWKLLAASLILFSLFLISSKPKARKQGN